MSQPSHLWPRQPTTADDPNRDDATFGRLLEAQRLLADRLAGAAPPPDVADDVTARLTELADLLERFQVPETRRHDGFRTALPGRGFALIPPYLVDLEDADVIRGRVTFGRHHLGRNGAVHGGVQPLLFDDLLGRVTNHDRPIVARTAYLKVDYKRIVLVGVEVHFEVWVDRVEGRKRYARGRISSATGDTLCEAESLYVELRTGQP